jgi:hypothetical protein
MEARRPTTNGAIIDGKTTMSRNGTRGSVVISGFWLGMWVLDRTSVMLCDWYGLLDCELLSRNAESLSD